MNATINPVAEAKTIAASKGVTLTDYQIEGIRMQRACGVMNPFDLLRTALGNTAFKALNLR